MRGLFFVRDIFYIDMKRSTMLCYILQMQNNLIYFGAYKHYGATIIVINKDIKIVYYSIYDVRELYK